MISKKNIQKQNFDNLLKVSYSIKNIEYFIFYGTLLGITRDDSIIKGDDDVDFMVSYNSKKILLKREGITL